MPYRNHKSSDKLPLQKTNIYASLKDTHLSMTSSITPAKKEDENFLRMTLKIVFFGS